MSSKTCFVIIGFGIKTDYATGREIDLDKTYRTIIEPVFKDMGFECFRACDIKHSGVIDVPMYDAILKADFVVADLTTLNANVLYELGVRHAVKKNTTVVIADKQLKYPFDLSHIVITPYEHLGKAIDYDEVIRFKQVLKELVVALVESPKTDSPLYTVFPELNMPLFTEKELAKIVANRDSSESLSEILDRAETAKVSQQFSDAIVLLNSAKKIAPNNAFIIQRLALATYKSKLPNVLTALKKAEEILQPLAPDTTTDVETLGLSGAINKRFYELTGDTMYLDKALWYYERGFYIRCDYYTGINAAYLFTIKALLETDRFEAIASYGHANVIRRQVIEICKGLMLNAGWKDRDDKQWVLLTLAEAHLALGQIDDMEKAVIQANEYMEGTFSLTAFLEQQTKLSEAIEQFKIRQL